ncbi:hypothetical protein ACFLIM_16615 [Nonomuraea sp. M3C6]|uniref:LPXTG-motif cell wall anchor domain-containing protein n=1 Tax=Nonomuraea marmarensis TaxID=3351344 RepID=A0ABW7ABS9_9ACTN
MRVELVVSAVLVFSHAAAPAAHEVASAVGYMCETKATGEKQTIQVDVELTVPTDAEVAVEMTIGWRGSYVEGEELLAPATGLDGDINLYAYAGISSIDQLTSATGVGQLGTITPGAPIPLPEETVNLKTTPRRPGEGTVHAAAINFGPRPQEIVIECEVLDTPARTEYPLAIPGTGQTGSPSPETSTTETTDPETASPEPTHTVTTTTTRTPAGGVATGGGGEAGPDGRMLVAMGSVLILASVTGLILRRRRRLAALQDPI